MSGDVLAVIATAASGPTTALVSGLTMAWPSRPKWVAFVAALVIGVVLTILAAFAFVAADVVFDRQLWAQIILSGLGSGLGAAGIGVAQSSAEAKRKEAAATTTEPDPTTPAARTGSPIV